MGLPRWPRAHSAWRLITHSCDQTHASLPMVPSSLSFSVPLSSLCSSLPSSMALPLPHPHVWPSLSSCETVCIISPAAQDRTSAFAPAPAQGVGLPCAPAAAGAEASLPRPRSKAGAAQRNTKLRARLPGEAERDLGRLQPWPWSLGPCPAGQDASLRLSCTPTLRLAPLTQPTPLQPRTPAPLTPTSFLVFSLVSQASVADGPLRWPLGDLPPAWKEVGSLQVGAPHPHEEE